MVRGTGLVNLVHSSGEADDFLPLDYWVFASDADQKIKNDHFWTFLKASSRRTKCWQTTFYLIPGTRAVRI